MATITMWPSQWKLALYAQACTLKKKTLKFKIICKMTHIPYKDWLGQNSAKEALNQQKNIIIPSYLPGYGEFENLCSFL